MRVKKGTGHLLLAKCLNLRRDGNDSAAAARRGVPGDEGRAPHGPLAASAGVTGIGCRIGTRRQERAVLALPHGRVPAEAEVARVGRADRHNYLETHISHCAVYWAVGGVILPPSRPLNREGCTQKAFVWVSLHHIGSSNTISLWEPRRIGGPQMPVPVETFRNAPPFACRPLRYG